MPRIPSAEGLVRRYRTRNPFAIARELEIPVHFLDHPESDLPGLTCLVLDRPSIFINTAYFDALQREDRSYTDAMMEDDILQVGAHELGHAVKHRRELRRSPIKEYEIFNVRVPMEAEANTFAAGIRIDTEEMLDLFNSDMDLLQVASAIHVNINLLIYKMDALRRSGFQFNQIPISAKNNFMGGIHGVGGWN